jgi:predicted CxxxxCH...CXXCH cytochrome family protein
MGFFSVRLAHGVLIISAMANRAARNVTIVVLTGLGIALVAMGPACSNEPDVTYGKPGLLTKEALPGEAGAEPLLCAGDAGADGGPCSVSWKKDIFPKMVGAWTCAASNCHAPGNKQAPAIDPADENASYTTLAGYKMSTKPMLNYIDNGGDPAKSSMECNLGGGCNPTMPIGNGMPLTQVERCQLHSWLRCGAPNN